MDYELVIKNGRLVIPKSGIVHASLGISKGIVQAILSPGCGEAEAREVIDAQGKYVLPGVIDPHVHIGYFNRDFRDWVLTETPGMAVGGVTTMIGFYRQYNRMPCAIGREEFDQLVGGITGRSGIDFSFHFMISAKAQEDSYPLYLQEYGINSFKFSTAYKAEEGKAHGITNLIDDGFILDSFNRLANYPNSVACVHCENVDIAYRLTEKLREAGRNDLAAYTEARPDYCEAESMSRILYFGQLAGCDIYVVHVSSARGMLENRDKKVFNQHRAYFETCPHYLTISNTSPVGILGKVNPPLRTQADIEGLWAGVLDGTIDTIGSDHCVVTRAQKTDTLWDGIVGFNASGMILPVLLSEGVNRRGLTLERVAELTSYNTARIFGLYPRKGTIQVGSDADLVIVDLEAEKLVSTATIPSAADFTLWDGWQMKGWPELTLVRGRVVAQDGVFRGATDWGGFVPRF